MVYSTNNLSIIGFNIVDNKKMIEIQKAHNKRIINFRHYFDHENKRDLIISLSEEINYLKLWNANNWDLLLILEHDNYYNSNSYLACFLNDNHINYIVISDYIKPKLIQVYNFECQKVKDINSLETVSYCIDSYYDKKMLSNYIIFASDNMIVSYDFNFNKIYHNYTFENQKKYTTFVINNNNDKLILIGGSSYGYIVIWDFHNGEVLKSILVSENYKINTICLWNNEYLYAGCNDKLVKLVDIINKKVVINLRECDNEILTLKKIYHPKYGECLISQSWNWENIKLWVKDK